MNIGNWELCFSRSAIQIRRRLKPRLHKRCPDGARTEDKIGGNFKRPFFNPQASGFCLYRSGFNQSSIKQLKTRFLQEIGLFKSMLKRDLISKLFGK